MRVINHN